MEAQPEQLTPDQLYDQALALFRSARWDEAIGALRQLQSQGGGAYPEAESLLADIQLKQGVERGQAPTAIAPPRERPSRVRGLALAAVALVTLGLIGGLRLMTSGVSPALTASVPAVSQQAVVGALPTPAPTQPSGAAGGAAGEGVLIVRPAEAAATVENIYFILDASGSMLARIDGQRKIEIARQAMGALVQDLGDSTRVALRTYGRNRADDCSDIELLSPLAPLDREGLLAQINAIQPVNLSRTPIGSSLAAIAADLGDTPGETLVVLLSDGEESCDGDPVAEATHLHADHPNVQVSVVGLDIAPESQERLAAIAEAGGGSYFGAADVDQLGAALKQALTLRYRVIDERGGVAGSANVGDSLKLPVGNYRVLIGGDPPLLEQKIDVRRGMATLMAVSSDHGQMTAALSRDWAP
ncbi:VWA domain-containing protein [Oscillochloris sp. ZM17-4]|uniref:VWA domain-containing protein n=1 Tax=Oscillochloris sp. ZM17-4 TaxID=2866714 RepID=UPI001C73A4B3|nr:VWA domain-containing protein [Oscillochloris sp. ZM17-4]MBX0327040.1 VWA domain-containing protein [Oscillochloris sp. ZM17-4]